MSRPCTCIYAMIYQSSGVEPWRDQNTCSTSVPIQNQYRLRYQYNLYININFLRNVDPNNTFETRYGWNNTKKTVRSNMSEIEMYAIWHFMRCLKRNCYFLHMILCWELIVPTLSAFWQHEGYARAGVTIVWLWKLTLYESVRPHEARAGCNARVLAISSTHLWTRWWERSIFIGHLQKRDQRTRILAKSACGKSS
jgi:hypothetical protein